MRLLVPPLDTEPWPTLGPEVCDWYEARLVHGPGDVLGDRITLTDEERLLLYRAYEIYPRDHERAGRRRFKRVAYYRRKGLRKTELAAWVAIGEMDPGAPVRCDGWRVVAGEWIPVGRSVRDPYIPMVAITEAQVEDLAFGAVYDIIAHSELADDYDLGLERIVHRDAPGKIQPLAAAPSARDGARTSFEHFDEPHLMVLPRAKQAHGTMLRNLAKRKAADPWAFETSTMYGPGEGSIAEATHEYALAILAGDVEDPTLLFDHREARQTHNLKTRKGLIDAIREASGDGWAWTDVEAIVGQFRDPKADEAANRRFWLNQRVRLSASWIDSVSFDALADKTREVAEGTQVLLGFDGSYNRDATIIVGATVEEHPHLFLVGAWERPPKSPKWRVPRGDVEQALFEAMDERFEVPELSCDPPGWHREIEDWERRYGDVVVRFDTNQPSRMGPACDQFIQAVADRAFTHDGSEVIKRHIANCEAFKRGRHTLIRQPDEDTPGSFRWIDAAAASVVALHRAFWHLSHDEDEDGPMFYRLDDV